MSDRPATRAAIYARSAIHDPVGIDRQVAACKQYANDRGYNIIDVYTDNGASAFTHRPELDDLRANIGQYGVIVAFNVDRLARSMQGLNTLVARAEYHGTTIETVEDDVRRTLRVIAGGTK